MPQVDDHILLACEGYIRGAPMSPNDLVHVTGVGDFQLVAIEELADPLPPGKRPGPARHAQGKLK